jgi:hypothetical protein
MPESAGEVLAMQELQNRVEIQKRKYRQSIPVTVDLDVAGTAGAQVPFQVKMGSEGDFLCTHITCKMIGIDPGTGLPVDPIIFGGTGITLMLSETGWGRKLLRDATALETFATPGYGTIIYQPFPFEQALLADSEVNFDFRNSSAVKQRVRFTLHGWQYRGSFKTQARS